MRGKFHHQSQISPDDQGYCTCVVQRVRRPRIANSDWSSELTDNVSYVFSILGPLAVRLVQIPNPTGTHRKIPGFSRLHVPKHLERGARNQSRGLIHDANGQISSAKHVSQLVSQPGQTLSRSAEKGILSFDTTWCRLGSPLQCSQSKMS